MVNATYITMELFIKFADFYSKISLVLDSLKIIGVMFIKSDFDH